MALLSGLGSYLFGINPVDDSEAKAAAAAQARLAAAYQSREANAYAGQQRLADTLWSTVNGQGPSVAGTQLEAGLDQSLANGNSMAASGTGVNGALARYAAILSAGQQAAQTNQTGALLRAQEEAQARAQLGGVTGAMAGESGGLAENSIDADLKALGLSAGIQESNQKTTAAVDGALLGGVSQLGASAIGAFGGPKTAAPSYGTAYAAMQPGLTASRDAGAGGPSPIYDPETDPEFGGNSSGASPGYSGSRSPYGSPYGGGYGSPYGDRY